MNDIFLKLPCYHMIIKYEKRGYYERTIEYDFWTNFSFIC